jgi:aminopeptidase N
MEYVGTDGVRPSWRMVCNLIKILNIKILYIRKYFAKIDQLFNLLLNVIQADSSDTTRPVSLEVNTPEEIESNIDGTITYGKGSSIVRILNYVLGDDTFRRGLTVGLIC